MIIVDCRGRRGRTPVLAGVVAVSTPVAAWWLVGDQSFGGRPGEELDYAFRAPDLSGWVTPVMGAIALAAGSLALMSLLFAARRREIDGRWRGVVTLLVVAGGLLAGIGRVATAGVIGANIGAGLAIFFGVPLCVVLILVALLKIRQIRRSDRLV